MRVVEAFVTADSLLALAPKSQDNWFCLLRNFDVSLRARSEGLSHVGKVGDCSDVCMLVALSLLAQSESQVAKTYLRNNFCPLKVQFKSADVRN